jgi:hypothetical protein
MATVNLFGELALDSSVQETNDKLDAVAVTRDTALGSTQKGTPALAVRRDADTAGVVDGNTTLLAVDEEGRLKTSNKTTNFAVTSAAVNTSGGIIVVDTRRASNIVMHVKNTGTVAMTAGAFAFEGSIDSTDGTNGTWFTIQAVRSNANTIESATGTLSIAVGAGLAYSWEASVNAYQYARVRCTTSVTASSAATWTIQRGSYATEPIPAAQTTAAQPVTQASGTAYNLTTAATTNAAVVKSTAGNLYEVSISNATATAAFVKFYNKATAPTVGTDIPVITLPIAAAGAGTGFVSVPFGTLGKRFGSGIGIAVTANAAATDTTATVAGIQVHGTYT